MNGKDCDVARDLSAAMAFLSSDMIFFRSFFDMDFHDALRFASNAALLGFSRSARLAHCWVCCCDCSDDVSASAMFLIDVVGSGSELFAENVVPTVYNTTTTIYRYRRTL